MGVSDIAHVNVTLAQQRAVSMTYFPLQQRKILKMGQMVTGKGMAQGILLPRLLGGAPFGFLSDDSPMVNPIRRADTLIITLFAAL